MKRRFGFLAIMTLCSFFSIAQDANIKEAKLIRINDGDPTFIFNLFEINLNKKNVHLINPIINYLDIKGGKQKYKVKLKRSDWNKIENFLLDINLHDYEQVEFDHKRYSIILFNEDTKGITYIPNNENEIDRLKRIIRVIRD
ncbi:hypothetical protein [Pararhodonellum marinum]|uniref:hypothetical protein n=1 Tax=Pararhodonellum marinum TaxID=2755358 RepID=UPI00188EEAF2|nr:hypothetical protein [Pararhodonellum marinum]